MVVDLLVGADLGHLAEVHHTDPVRDVPDDRQVVGDEEVGQVELVLQSLHQVDDLCLDGDVQGRHRLVADDDLGVQGQAAGDADALALTAGELVRIAVDVLRVEADDVQELLHLAAPVALRGHLGVDVERLPDDVAHRHTGVQRGVGVLEHHLDVPADRLQRAPGQLGDVLALVEDLAGGRLLQHHQQLGDRGLAASGLAHYAERLALEEVEGDAVDRLDRPDLLLEEDALGEREVLDQVAHLQDRLAPLDRRLDRGDRLRLGAGVDDLDFGDVRLGVLRLVGLAELSHGSSPSRSGRPSRGRPARCRPARRPGAGAGRRYGRRPGPGGSAG